MDPKIIELTSNNTCQICENRLGKYTCPRCNILYCTVSCYQSENHLECSETFYQKCVHDELNSQGPNDESKAKMEEILKRFHEEQLEEEDVNLDSDDDANIPDISERLADISLDDPSKVWEALTPDERQEFEALVASGDITKFVDVWSPWWNFKEQSKLVQEVGNETKTNFVKKCPMIMENIKPFYGISKVEPAHCVKYNLLNVICAYTCIVRYFNGDHFDFAEEAVYLLTNLSKNLLTNENFESFSLAMESVHQQILVNDWIKTDEDVKNRMYSDVNNLIRGPDKNHKTFYIISALSDMHKLYNASKKSTCTKNDEFSKRFRENGLPPEKCIPKSKIKMYLRKIEYYLSYVNTFVPCYDQ